MKCVSYDYAFESDLATRWKALDRSTSQGSGGTKRSSTQGSSSRRRVRPLITLDDSEDEDDAPKGKSREHLSRKVRGRVCTPYSTASGPEGLSGEDEEDLYHDADGGDLSDYP